MGTVHAKENRHKMFSDIDTEDPQPRQKMKFAGVRARVDKVNIDGLGRTKDDIIKDTVNELFQARDFEEVIVKADNVRSKLDSLGCFSNVGVYIDVSSGPNATPEGLEVTFHVKELSKLIGGVNTMVGNNEGTLLVGTKAPNILGRGECVQCEYSIGNRKTSEFSLSFKKPYPHIKLQPMFTAGIIQESGVFPWSGYKQLDRKLLMDVTFKSTNKTTHNVQWEGVFRETSVLSRNTSFAVRKDTGPTMKSSLRHIVTVDGRDENVFPTQGSMVRFTSELSGLGGSMAFLKNHVAFQHNVQVIKDFVVQGTMQMGLLNNFHGTNITERFFVGGPLNIRGYSERGIGPQSEGNALGGNFEYAENGVKGSKLYWASGLHLYTPLPFRPGKGGLGDLFRTHFFVNVGNIGDFKPDYHTDTTPAYSGRDDDVDYEFRDQELEKNLEFLTKNMRLATGLGLALRIGNIARLELNYCFPMWHQPGDMVSPGIQFGLGVNFL